MERCMRTSNGLACRVEVSRSAWTSHTAVGVSSCAPNHLPLVLSFSQAAPDHQPSLAR